LPKQRCVRTRPCNQLSEVWLFNISIQSTEIEIVQVYRVTSFIELLYYYKNISSLYCNYVCTLYWTVERPYVIQASFAQTKVYEINTRHLWFLLLPFSLVTIYMPSIIQPANWKKKIHTSSDIPLHIILNDVHISRRETFKWFQCLTDTTISPSLLLQIIEALPRWSIRTPHHLSFRYHIAFIIDYSCDHQTQIWNSIALCLGLMLRISIFKFSPFIFPQIY